ncbi:hypothetical protein GmarT_54120 [Gimesia maris]|uniref:Secreted protein n=1 Tax=Gimesia maris TaxID=122 RepID=A0ABX5YUT4_9PLAN|nr:hypothetical protein GmarT_54120 [Gimesia maris]
MCANGETRMSVLVVNFVFRQVFFTTTKNTKPHAKDFSGELIMETAALRLICVLLPHAAFSGGLNSCGSVNLREGREAIKWIMGMMWRTVLIGNRCWSDQWRCRGERLRCVATRRHTSRTGVDSGSANLEKTGCFIVKIRNRYRVFWCTVNWPRARPETTLIASGASGSSAISTVAVTGFQQCALCRCIFVLVKFFHECIDGIGRTECEDAVAGVEDGCTRRWHLGLLTGSTDADDHDAFGAEIGLV